MNKTVTDGYVEFNFAEDLAEVQAHIFQILETYNPNGNQGRYLILREIQQLVEKVDAVWSKTYHLDMAEVVNQGSKNMLAAMLAGIEISSPQKEATDAGN